MIFFGNDVLWSSLWRSKNTIISSFEHQRREHRFESNIAIYSVSEGKMTVFQAIQNNLRLLGYIQNHDGYRYYIFRRSHFIAISITVFAIGIISLFTFAVYLANSPAEYMDSFYSLAILFTMFVSYINTISNMPKLFRFIDDCEKVCDEGEFYFHCIFESLNVT